MIERVEIPLFPLTILPLPRERFPLHIFEPRYKQLFQEVEAENKSFGIYYSHGLNKDRLGGYIQLDEIVKRYSSGEMDVIVSCTQNFILSKYYNKLHDKLYPGGIVSPIALDEDSVLSEKFTREFIEYMEMKQSPIMHDLDIYDVAIALDLTISDRLSYLKLIHHDKKEAFLLERLRYAKLILQQELKVVNNQFLN